MARNSGSLFLNNIYEQQQASFIILVYQYSVADRSFHKPISGDLRSSKFQKQLAPSVLVGFDIRELSPHQPEICSAIPATYVALVKSDFIFEKTFNFLRNIIRQRVISAKNSSARTKPCFF